MFTTIAQIASQIVAKIAARFAPAAKAATESAPVFGPRRPFDPVGWDEGDR